MNLKLSPRRFWILCGIALTVVVIAPLWAGQPQVLPQDVNLVAIDGTAVTTANIGGTARWLLIYMRSGNHSSEVLLGQIDETNFPGMTSNIVVIVAGANADGLKQIAAKFPGLSKAGWYADTPRALATAMKIGGSPVMFGMQDRNAQWDLSGALFDATKLKSIITSWFNPPPSSSSGGM